MDSLAFIGSRKVRGLKLEEDTGGLGKLRGLNLEEDTGGISREKAFGRLVHIICTKIKRLRLYYAICSKLYQLVVIINSKEKI